MISAGTILQNDQGRITWPDGSNIARGFNENYPYSSQSELALGRNQQRHTCHHYYSRSRTCLQDDYIVHNGQVFLQFEERRIDPKEGSPWRPQTKDYIRGIRLPPSQLHPSLWTDSTRAQNRTSSTTCDLWTTPCTINPFDDDEIMEDISSDASTDSTTFPVKKTPKRPKRPTKPSKPQSVIPSIPNDSIPNDQSMKKDLLRNSNQNFSVTLNVDTLVDKYWRPRQWSP